VYILEHLQKFVELVMFPKNERKNVYFLKRENLVEIHFQMPTLPIVNAAIFRWLLLDWWKCDMPKLSKLFTLS